MVFTEMLYICVVHISWRCGSVSLNLPYSVNVLMALINCTEMLYVHMEWIIASYQLKALYDV